MSQNNLHNLKEALNKLSLNDASLSISSEQSAFLGTGFKVGFLGLLHADIVREKLILFRTGSLGFCFFLNHLIVKEKQ